MKIKNIPEGAKEAYKSKVMRVNVLISLRVLSENGFKIILYQNKISITKQGKYIIEGYHENHIELWRISLEETEDKMIVNTIKI